MKNLSNIVKFLPPSSFFNLSYHKEGPHEIILSNCAVISTFPDILPSNWSSIWPSKTFLPDFVDSHTICFKPHSSLVIPKDFYTYLSAFKQKSFSLSKKHSYASLFLLPNLLHAEEEAEDVFCQMSLNYAIDAPFILPFSAPLYYFILLKPSLVYYNDTEIHFINLYQPFDIPPTLCIVSKEKASSTSMTAPLPPDYKASWLKPTI